MPIDQDTSLFGEFPPITKEQWLEAVQADLKGADFEKRLVTKTEEGIKVLPYYVASDAPPSSQMPGSPPYTRGYRSAGNEWDVREFVVASDPVEANKRALRALMRGAQQIEFSIAPEARVDKAYLTKLIEGVHLDAARVVVAGCGLNETLPGVGRVEDPIAQAIATDRLDSSVLGAVVGRLRAKQGTPAVGISGLAVQEAGGSASQEIAYVLGALVDILDAATESGASAQDVAPQVEVRMGSGTQFLLEIAKLRAARMLLYRVLAGYGIGDARPSLHVQTSRLSLSVYDPHVNMLRATTQAMAAAIAGADSIAVVPYDAAFQPSDELASRIARNVQIILRDESYLGKVVDPLGGSYAIESLTNSIADSAWALFLRYEEEGGLIQAWRKGWPGQELESVRQTRLKAASSRRQPIVGTSNYPNQKEVGPRAVVPSFGDTPGGALTVSRLSEAFERLRLRSDRSPKRPKVALVQAGDAKMRKARATFAAGFFGSAGYEVVEIVEADMAQAAKQAHDAGADVVVLCSSDPEYPSLAGPLAQAIKASGLPARLVVAGNPVDSIDELKALGVQDFVHIKCDVVETLSRFHEALGIAEVKA